MSRLRESALAVLDRRGDPNGGAILSRLRAEGEHRFRADGLPTTKDEAWRFTPIRPLAAIPFGSGGGGSAASVLCANRTGVEVSTLSEALRSTPQLVEAYLGRLAKNEHFVALSSAMLEDGVFVRVREGARVREPIEVNVGVTEGSYGEPTVVSPRVLMVAEHGSRALLVEHHRGTGDVPVLTNAVAEIAIEPGAEVEHVRIHDGWSLGRTVETVAVRVDRDGRFRSRVFSFGGALSRLDLHVVLDGEGAECHLDGLYVVGGVDHVDHQTLVEHRRPHGTSNQKYKGILEGRARAVFDGRVVVHRDAQKTSAHQENRNLLLSDDAVVNTKPHLEIDADDVQCSHGAVVGRLDDLQLFYLRSRGIDIERSRAVLLSAFAREMIERVEQASLRSCLAELLSARLGSSSMLEDLQ